MQRGCAAVDRPAAQRCRKRAPFRCFQAVRRTPAAARCAPSRRAAVLSLLAAPAHGRAVAAVAAARGWGTRKRLVSAPTDAAVKPGCRTHVVRSARASALRTTVSLSCRSKLSRIASGGGLRSTSTASRTCARSASADALMRCAARRRRQTSVCDRLRSAPQSPGRRLRRRELLLACSVPFGARSGAPTAAPAVAPPPQVARVTTSAWGRTRGAGDAAARRGTARHLVRFPGCFLKALQQTV